MSYAKCLKWSSGIGIILLLCVLYLSQRLAEAEDRIPLPKRLGDVCRFESVEKAKPEPIHAPVEFKAGIYKVDGDIDGRAYWGSCTITKHHDAYRVASILRMDRKQPLQTVGGVGILLGDMFAVGGPSGVALYRVMDDGELVGSWTSDNGRVHREKLKLLKVEE